MGRTIAFLEEFLPFLCLMEKEYVNLRHKTIN